MGCPECFALIAVLTEEEQLQYGTMKTCESCGKIVCPLSSSRLATRGSSNDASCSSSSEFRIIIDRSQGNEFGIQVEVSPSHLLVPSVVQEGLVEQWNYGHHEAEVRRGDLLVEANGIQGDSDQLTAELQQKK